MLFLSEQALDRCLFFLNTNTRVSLENKGIADFWKSAHNYSLLDTSYATYDKKADIESLQGK